MSVSYQKVAFLGAVVSVDRLQDGAFTMNFGVPPAGAPAAVVDQYRQNEHYRRYEADVAAGAVVAEPLPPPIVYAGHQSPEARVTTTDATPAELFRRTLASLTAYTALVDLVGIDAGNGAVRYVRATVVAKRLNAGALLVSTPTVVANHADTGTAAWTLAATVSGNDVVIVVTGAAGRTVNWFARLGIDSFTPGGQP